MVLLVATRVPVKVRKAPHAIEMVSDDRIDVPSGVTTYVNLLVVVPYEEKTVIGASTIDRKRVRKYKTSTKFPFSPTVESSLT